MEICPAYISKYNFNREKQVTILMIPNGKGWHYLAVKKLSALLRRITSKYSGKCYCLNCLHSFRTKNKSECHKKYLKIKVFVELLCQLKKIIYERLTNI